MFNINNALRHAERRGIFNVDDQRRPVAESVNRSPDDNRRPEKARRGGFNCTFLITIRGGFQMVARILYPATVPKYFSVASEVATMTVLRSSRLPIPEVYGYSLTPGNASETEYIFMDLVEGTSLSDTWFGLGEGDIISIARHLAELSRRWCRLLSPMAEARTIPKTWRSRPGGRASR